MYEYDFLQKTWSCIQPVGFTGLENLHDLPMMNNVEVEDHSSIPKARAAHTAVLRTVSLHDERMVLFGGWNGYLYYNDLYEFHFTTNQWNKFKCDENTPSPRNTHIAVMRQNKSMVIFGGSHANVRYNDLYEYHFASATWNKLEPGPNSMAPPKARGAARAVMLDESDKLLVYGGKPSSFLTLKLSDVFLFDFQKRIWTELHIVDFCSEKPEPLSSFAMVHAYSRGNEHKVCCMKNMKQPGSEETRYPAHSRTHSQ